MKICKNSLNRGASLPGDKIFHDGPANYFKQESYERGKLDIEINITFFKARDFSKLRYTFNNCSYPSNSDLSIPGHSKLRLP